jgi:SAM-dependent methyltransferase
MKKVLNVGGNNKQILLPQIYSEYEHLLLDIDPRGEPDILCDARNLASFNETQFDAVYCSHNLEHYYRHDVTKVLQGFHNILKPNGFVQIKVPDIDAVMRSVIEKNLDIEDILYVSPAGPIMVLDVLYGFSIEIERSGNDFFAHKTGFTEKSLINALAVAGFTYVYTTCDNLEISAIALKQEPNAYLTELLELDDLQTN